MRARIVSTGDKFCIGDDCETLNTVHLDRNRQKQWVWHPGAKEPTYGERHSRQPEGGAIAIISQLEGTLRQEEGRIVFPSAREWGMADEFDFLVTAGRNPEVEQYRILRCSSGKGGDASENFFTGSLVQLKHEFPRSKDREICLSGQSLSFEAKLTGKDGFVSCPDPRVWVPPAPPAPTPPKPIVKTQPSTLYYVDRHTIDPVTLERVCETLADGISEEEYDERFYNKFPELLQGYMFIVGWAQNVRTREIRYVFYRYNLEFSVRPQPAAASA